MHVLPLLNEAGDEFKEKLGRTTYDYMLVKHIF